MSQLQQLQDELRSHEANLQEIEDILASAPDYQDALDMKEETLAKKKETGSKIAALRGSAATETSSTTEKPVADVSSPYRKKESKPNASAVDQHTFKVNDSVSAKYHGDKTFYPASIISITGSSAEPIYTVKFKGYSGTETVRHWEIRPLHSSSSTAPGTKRKADGSPAGTSSSTPVQASAPVGPPGIAPGSSTISAAANIDQDRKEALERQTSNAPKGLPQPERLNKKIRSDKQLNTAKNSWQDFQKKGATGKAAKLVKKESMFRTGDSATARVGFTGSGQAMRKDVGRERFKYDLDKGNDD